MIYRLPELSDKEMLMAYVSEHWDNGENSISASVGMLAGEFSDWVRNIHKNASIGNEECERSLMYLCLNDNQLIGLLSIRYELSESLRNKCGISDMVLEHLKEIKDTPQKCWDMHYLSANRKA